MIKITWKGEDSESEPGPSFNVWNGVQFPKGQAVDLDQTTLSDALKAHMIAKAKVNQFYTVQDDAIDLASKPTEARRETQKGEEEQAQEFNYKTEKNKSGYKPKRQKAKKQKPQADIAPAPVEPGPDADA